MRKRERDKKILVTGGAGFIGSHLVDRLLNEKNNVVVLDNFNDYYLPQIKRNNIKAFLGNSDFKLIEKDIRDNLDDVFTGSKIDLIVHLEARAGVRALNKDPVLYKGIYVLGKTNLLGCCRKYNIKKFIFGSLSSVYGVTSRVPFS